MRLSLLSTPLVSLLYFLLSLLRYWLAAETEHALGSLVDVNASLGELDGLFSVSLLVFLFFFGGDHSQLFLLDPISIDFGSFGRDFRRSRVGKIDSFALVVLFECGFFRFDYFFSN